MATSAACQLSEEGEVQLRVFTRWVNWKLRKTDMQVGSLETDLESGVGLLRLMEVLAPGKKLTKYHKKPTKTAHKTQNLSAALTFITETEKIDLDDIKPSDIAEHNLPKILKLIRSLVLHYQLWEPQEALLEFLNAALPERDISNFTTNWRDGSNLATLVNFCKPDLISSATQEHNDALQNITNAMDVAEKELHVPQLLLPEDLAAEIPDELSVMIYVSCFFIGTDSPGEHALLSRIKDRIPSRKINNFSSDWENGIALGALVNAVSKGQFSAYQTMSSKSSKGLDNCREAMEAAERILGIKKPFEPEDFNSSSLKRMTYLAHLCRVSLQPKVLDLHVPEKVASDEMVWLDVVCYDKGPEDINASAEGKEVGQVPVEINVLSQVDCKYRIQFSAKEADVYTFSIQVSENDIQGSPFHISLTPPDPSRVVHTSTVLPDKVGDQAILSFDTLEAGRGDLVAEVIGKMVGSIPVNVDQVSLTNFRVLFVPNQPDIYHVHVMFDNKPVKDAPFELDLQSQPEKVMCGELLYGHVGQTARLPVDHSRAGKGKVTAACIGRETGDLEVKVDYVRDGHSEITLTPGEDLYTLSVFFEEIEVHGSPFLIDLRPISNPSKVKILGLEKLTHIALVNEPITFHINTADAGRGSLNIKVGDLTKGMDYQLDFKPTANGSPVYDVTYTPAVPGMHKLHLLWAEVEIPRSPVVIHATSPQLFVCGSPVSIQVDVESKRKDMRAFALPAGKPTSAQLKAKVNKISHGHFEIVAEPKDPGIYYVHVLSKDKEIEGSPYVVNYFSESKPEACVVHGLTDVGYIGEPIKFTVDTSKAGSGELTVHGRGEAECNGIVKNIGNGIYSAEFTPCSEGNYEFGMRFAGTPISGDPFKIVIHKHKAMEAEAPDAGETIPTEEGSKGEVVTAEVSISELPPQHMPVPEISVPEMPVPENPVPEVVVIPITPELKASVIPPVSPEEVDVTSPETRDEALRTETKALMEEQAVTPAGGAIILVGTPTEQKTPENFKKAKAEKEAEKKIKKERATSEEKATVDKSVTSAETLRSDTADNKRSDRNDSVASTKSETSNSLIPQLVTTSLNLENENFRVGVPHKLILHCDDLGEDYPDVACEPESGVDILLNPAPGANSYWCEIIPKETGQHMISVQYKGTHIFGSPFHVHFFPRGDATKCEMIKPTFPDCQQRAGNDVAICITTKGAGRGKITASIKSLSTKNHLPVSITYPYEHHYNVAFDPSEGDDYILTVKYDDENIQGSPFRLELGDSSQCFVDGDDIYSAQINQLSKFRVMTEDAGPGSLMIYVEGEEETLQPTVTAIDSKRQEVSYLPTRGGIYNVFVRWSGRNIPGSPFKAICIDPSQVNVVERTMESFPGKLLSFTVTSPLETQDENKLTISAHTDDCMVPGKVEKVDKLTYSCIVDPQTPGTYSVDICWGEVHINGSPLEVKVMPSPKPSDFTVTAAALESSSLGLEISGPSQAFKYGELTASVKNDTTKENLPVTVTPKSHNHCTVAFEPIRSDGIDYTLSIEYDGGHIIGSPFTLMSKGTFQCTTKGKGLRFATIGDWNRFTVDAKNAGVGGLKVHIKREGELVEPLISAASKTHYHVEYMPKRRGIYTIAVMWDNQHVPNSPFKVYSSNPAKFYVKESIKDAPTKIPIKFTVETPQTPVEWEELSVTAHSKHKKDIHGEVKQGSGGKYKCSITIPETGEYMIHVQCNGFEISGSPFRVHLMPTPVPENVHAYGPGLEDGYTDQEGTFTINVAEAGHGYLSFRVEGPKGAFRIHMQRHPKKKGVLLAQYNPVHAGKYTINVLWSGMHIPGSPFIVSILGTKVKELALLPGEHLSYTAHDVTYLDPFLSPKIGILYITDYKINFISAPRDKPDEEYILNVPVGVISHIEKIDWSQRLRENAYGLKIHCKDLRTLIFTYTEKTQHRMYEKLQTVAFPVSYHNSLFAYKFRGSYPEDGWKVYNAEMELKRLGLDSGNVPWRITHVNEGFRVCKTYPALLGVPTACSDDNIRAVAQFRSEGRLPVLSWLHPVTRASITRSSQPLVGLEMKHSEEDEAYIQTISRTNEHSKKIFIMDARPKTDAVAVTANGGGYEYKDFYPTMDFSFLDIDNLHVMRESLHRLQEMSFPAEDDPRWLSKLESTHWLDHIKAVLGGGVRVAEVIEKHKSSVIVHCSYGWDRTAQLTALAMLMLDPHYRTIRGFETLVDKEWVSFGHRFSQRIGHGDKNYSDDLRAPIFLQFIDCVWQMTMQFPYAFEFNEHFLITILDHMYSCLFGTFLGNCEKVRVDGHVQQKTVSLWSFINSQMEVYKNPLFSEHLHQQVLFPNASIRKLQLWNGYYLRWNPRLRPQAERESRELTGQKKDGKKAATAIA